MFSSRWERHLALELLLLLHLFLATTIQGHSKQIAISGSNVSLQISNLPADYKILTWLYTSEQKIVEHWNADKPHYFDSTFKHRVVLNLSSGALNIYKVQKEDSSTYLLRVVKAAGNEEEWKIPLEVFDPVPKPRINITTTQEVNNGCYLNIACEIPDQSVNYTWYGESGPFPRTPQSAVLEVTVGPQNYSKFYTCQVSNPVSSENDTVYFTSPCEQAISSGVAWIATWLAITVPTVFGLLWT
ncbi:CD48 antigen [Diceros bicornis minor]|uniref:CD48 antigen n=1 Tax=Diceros bicornis minor TaxID=77932 RepID=UPI0026EC0658|nr:CD48 antigen [Diceros bicornis minor]